LGNEFILHRHIIASVELYHVDSWI